MGAVDGTPPSLLAVLEMKRRGIDIAWHRARNISSVTVADFDMVVALDREVAALFWVAHPEYPGLRIWIVPDPYGGSAGEYREAADLISRMSRNLSNRNLPVYSALLLFSVLASSPQSPLPLPVSREGGEGSRSHGIPRPRPAKPGRGFRGEGRKRGLGQQRLSKNVSVVIFSLRSLR